MRAACSVETLKSSMAVPTSSSVATWLGVGVRVRVRVTFRVRGRVKVGVRVGVGVGVRVRVRVATSLSRILAHDSAMRMIASSWRT